MTPEQIKQYFEKNPPPKSIDWRPWAKISDTEQFLHHTFVLINQHKGSLENCPAWWRLREFYQDALNNFNVK